MPAAFDVTPGKWSNIRVLFDNGWYSVIAGDYEGKAVLGERWNGDEGTLGFPNQAGHPIWHVVPSFLEVPILHALLDEIARKPPPDFQKYLITIAHELRVRLQGRT